MPLSDLLFTVDQGICSSVRGDVNGDGSCPIGARKDFVLSGWKMKRLKLRHSQCKENKDACECHQKKKIASPLLGTQASFTLIHDFSYRLSPSNILL